MRTLKEVEGVPVWEKDPVESPPKEGDPNLPTWVQMVVGPAAKGNEMSFLKALQEMPSSQGYRTHQPGKLSSSVWLLVRAVFSVAFLGKSWHQKLRRPFLFCGGKPAMSLARFLGGSSNIQKACGAMGVFAISGFLHEYPMYAVQREPHPYPRELFKSLPASFLFFFVQSFGVILEPFIIPHIPKRLGGGKLWTASFLLLTAPLFTRDICRPPGMFNRSGPLQQWTWLDIVVPGPLAARAFSLT
ncbi:hypothetical protein KEM48_007541 [Puccinia striiformis f. sp. tritici PST-130]|nr:hypothetical protein KEM48_007541 [Puccinia striiformis f. sp. tritici PST-130]